MAMVLERAPALRGFLGGLLAGAALTALWVGMSYGTDLIWHFHPLLVGPAAGWGHRRARGSAGERRDLAALAAVTASLVALGAAVIAAGGRGLDPGWLVALVAGAGLAIGLRLLARG